MIDADSLRLLPVAIRVALAGHGPIDTAIAAAVEHHDPAWDTASALHQLLPGEREASVAAATALRTLAHALARPGLGTAATIAATRTITTYQ